MPLGLSGFIFHTAVGGGCFIWLEKDKEKRTQEILLYIYVWVLLFVIMHIGFLFSAA